jgi:hypothetical protein
MSAFDSTGSPARSGSRTRPQRQRLPRLLWALLLTSAVWISLPAMATPMRGTLKTLVAPTSTKRAFLSIETKEGVHSFVFEPARREEDLPGERHLVGASVRPAFDGSLTKASLSLFNDTGFLFFSSRRRNRPHSVQFSLVRTREGLQLGRMRLSSAPGTAIGCTTESRSTHPSPRPSQRRVGRMQLEAPLRVLEVDAEADYEFFRRYGSQTRNYIRSTLRAADTLYTSNLGIHIKLTSLRVTNQGAIQGSVAPAETVLESFRRLARPSRTTADVHHLFTGKQLDGATIGLAYVGTACMGGERFNSGISRAVSRALQPVLAAHEIAHNLGASHDQARRSIMNPAPRSGSVSFSEVAREDIRLFVEDAGACLDLAIGR